MSSASTEKSPARPTPGPATNSGATSGTVAHTDGPLQSSQGSTQIAETVVSKIAGVSAREVHGVYNLGGGAARAFGAIRERIPGAATSASQGVSVEVGERQAAVDIDIVVEYGVAIAELAKSVRRNVIGAIERMTGLQVVEVNVNVNDVHLPTDDNGEGSSDGAREQRDTPRVA